jgi:hypothetical protein
MELQRGPNEPFRGRVPLLVEFGFAGLGVAIMTETAIV